MLWPLSLLYGSVAGIRRLYFELFNKRSSTKIPTIIVGNLTVGGTGKTPMVLFLSNLLKSDYQLAVLSRGYGRKTNGFIEVEAKSLSENVGDEPKEIKLQEPELPVFVCENRLEGIEEIHDLDGNINMVLLDDGFQHLPLRANLNILLCNYQRPFYKDLVLPAGRLREFKSTAKGADMIIVTKCPQELSIDEAADMEIILMRYCRHVFFAYYRVCQPILLVGDQRVFGGNKIVLVTGVAEGKSVEEGLVGIEVVKHFEYRDHSEFVLQDVREWIAYAKDFEVEHLVMTRKDWMRVSDLVKDSEIWCGLNIHEIHTEVSLLFGGMKTFKNTLIKKL